MNKPEQKLDYYPLTLERWKDFETLFGQRGACGGCWCMHWRLTKSIFEKQKGAGNKKAMKKIVSSGEVPGILIYLKPLSLYLDELPRDIRFADLISLAQKRDEICIGYRIQEKQNDVNAHFGIILNPPKDAAV